MSKSNPQDNDGDSWIFDSLVNFLHGNIWKMPVLGFVEDKSVVFDPDSYANLSDEREEEFRKVHEEYKNLVDYMLSSFMDDLQVTPEQVEEACQQRERQANVPDSHITKVALEQLQAAEDFNIFRRIMTRKNIDLQLQSLELLVSKYGVLSPSLRSEGCDPGDTGEDDFLQVVIRYCGDTDVFEVNNVTSQKSAKTTTPIVRHSSCTLHQKALSETGGSPVFGESSFKKSEERSNPNPKIPILEDENKNGRGKSTASELQMSTKSDAEFDKILSLSDSPTNVTQIPVIREKAKQISTPSPPNILSQNAFYHDSSQLIQQDLSDEGGSKQSISVADMGIEAIQPARLQQFQVSQVQIPSHSPQPAGQAKEGIQALNKGRKKESKKSVKFDETTVAEIATVAPEQHRMLTSVRKALDVDSDNDLDAGAMNLDMTGSEEDIEKRRAYLRTQRDKLVALKKRERERQLEDGAGHASRPKSARAAQMAMRSPPSGTGEKSLAARRALAAVLKQELLDK